MVVGLTITHTQLQTFGSLDPGIIRMGLISVAALNGLILKQKYFTIHFVVTLNPRQRTRYKNQNWYFEMS